MRHLRAAAKVLERAAGQAGKLDEAEHDGARLIAWGGVFETLHEAELEVEALKVVAADETLEQLERNREQLSRSEAAQLRRQMRAIRAKALRALGRA